MLKQIASLIASLTAVLLLYIAFTPSALAQQRPLGVGLILGDPTGISFKYWKSRGNAYDAGATWSLDADDAFQLHGDYLWHNFDLTGEERTPVYYGLGARLRLGGDQAGLGARLPIGITHILTQEPIDIFFEVAPVISVLPDPGLDLEAGVGVRYYFQQKRL